MPYSQSYPPTEAGVLLRYDANKRSAGIAYLLWFLLGTLGGHRFYLKRGGSGAIILIITIVSFLLSFVVIGIFGFFIIGLWLLVDLFPDPGDDAGLQQPADRIAAGLAPGG